MSYFIINITSSCVSFVEVVTLQTSITNKCSLVEELQSTLGNYEVEYLIQREQLKKLETTIQEMEETRKTSSLVLQNSSDIIPLSGYNNYRLIS